MTLTKWEIQAKIKALRQARDEAYREGRMKEWSELQAQIRKLDSELAVFE